MNLDSIINFIGSLQEFVTLNSSFDTIIKGFLLYLAFFWVALVIWVAKDAIARSNSIIFHVLVIILNIFLPVFGLMIYLLIRPSRTLLDKYYEDLEFQALTGHDKKFCLKCHAMVEDGFKFCGKCGENLMQTCKKCKKDFSKEYEICPFCGEKHK
ncbi:zinc ribbon domain-containing protein [Candidatus Gracilibacteria bacterium]|nr:zinc ribbon domain-containing protein [Candidatus Gracilibacteria bacterium]